jgi:hypothetical protein
MLLQVLTGSPGVRNQFIILGLASRVIRLQKTEKIGYQACVPGDVIKHTLRNLVSGGEPALMVIASHG